MCVTPLFIYLFIYLFVYLFIYLFIYYLSSHLCWMKLRQSYMYLFNTTSDKERNSNECLQQHCGPLRRKLARKSCLRLFCLESFLFCRLSCSQSWIICSLLDYRTCDEPLRTSAWEITWWWFTKSTKNNGNKTYTCLEGSGGGGEIHILLTAILEGIPISLVMCTGIHISLWHRDIWYPRAHITISGEFTSSWAATPLKHITGKHIYL